MRIEASTQFFQMHRSICASTDNVVWQTVCIGGLWIQVAYFGFWSKDPSSFNYSPQQLYIHNMWCIFHYLVLHYAYQLQSRWPANTNEKCRRQFSRSMDVKHPTMQHHQYVQSFLFPFVYSLFAHDLSFCKSIFFSSKDVNTSQAIISIVEGHQLNIHQHHHVPPNVSVLTIFLINIELLLQMYWLDILVLLALTAARWFMSLYLLYYILKKCTCVVD